MNVNMLVIIVCVLSFIIGILIGIFIFKIYKRKADKKILKGLEEVLDGKRENKIKIDGVEHDASRFVVRDKDGKPILIDLKGGEIQDEEKNSNQEGSQREEVKDSSTSRESSRSARNIERDSSKKKRNSRNGSRIRRFG